MLFATTAFYESSEPVVELLKVGGLRLTLFLNSQTHNQWLQNFIDMSSMVMHALFLHFSVHLNILSSTSLRTNFSQNI